MIEAEEDFSEEMQRLINEAQTEMAELRAEGDAHSSGTKKEAARLATEIVALQHLVEKSVSKLSQLEEQLSAHTKTLDAIQRIQNLLERAQEVENAHQRLFNALHEELKGYKDAFLFEALQKPFLKDLIAFHDDLAAARQQIFQVRDALRQQLLDPTAAALAVETSANNVENLMHLLIEILNRLDVTREQNSTGPVDKRRHKVISTEMTDTSAQDGMIIESLRPGFSWKGRILRPEEVRIWRAQS